MPLIYIDMSRLIHLYFIWIELLWNEMHLVLRGAEITHLSMLFMKIYAINLPNLKLNCGPRFLYCQK